MLIPSDYAPTPISLNIVDNFPTLTSSVGVKNATFEIFVQRSRQPVYLQCSPLNIIHLKLTSAHKLAHDTTFTSEGGVVNSSGLE